MCVVALAIDVHPRWRLLLAGNRDEMYARPSAPLARWSDASGIVAGRDLQAGGTWMGVRAPDHAAVVTNVRDPRTAADGESRGLLITDYLRGDRDAAAQAAHLAQGETHYRPFNLLLIDRAGVQFVSNHPTPRTRTLTAGVHGLSNGDLDEPWPKTLRAMAAVSDWASAGATDFAPLLNAFRDDNPAADAILPDTGVGLEMERLLSPVFVHGERYGTRATTVIALDRDGSGCIVERRFGPGGSYAGETTLDF